MRGEALNNKLHIVNTLQLLKVNMAYKGSQYIISCIDLMNTENNSSMMLKSLYIETAKKYNTSPACIEKDIRKVIQSIWENKENEEAIIEIFGVEMLQEKPCIKPFLSSLYRYLQIKEAKNKLFSCPFSDNICEYCSSMIYELISQMYFL